MIPENLTKDVRQNENDIKPCLDKKEIVNQGYEEPVRETRVTVHFEEPQREEMVNLLKKYIDMFPWSYDHMIG